MENKNNEVKEMSDSTKKAVWRFANSPFFVTLIGSIVILFASSSWQSRESDIKRRSDYQAMILSEKTKSLVTLTENHYLFIQRVEAKFMLTMKAIKYYRDNHGNVDASMMYHFKIYFELYDASIFSSFFPGYYSFVYKNLFSGGESFVLLDKYYSEFEYFISYVNSVSDLYSKYHVNMSEEDLAMLNEFDLDGAIEDFLLRKNRFSQHLVNVRDFVLKENSKVEDYLGLNYQK